MPAGPQTDQELIAFDAEHICHGVTPIGTNIGFIIDKASGVSFFDTSGKEYLDGSSQLVCVSLGYRYKDEIAEAAAAQMRQLPYLTTFWGFSCKALIEATQRLIELSPDGIERFWFTTGGSETTETAIQFARRYWKSKGSSKYKIVSLYNSYHGVMFGSITATGVAYGGFSQDYAPLVPGFVKAPSYYCYRCMLDKEYPECGIACAKQLDAIIKNEGPDSVAAFIAEPMHGTAGDIPPVPEYWPMVREICDKHDVLLIADEVMTGFGRTGKAFGMQHWDVLPDMLCMAKGITSTYAPFGALGLGEKVYAGLKGMAIPAQTYGGHPVGAAVASKVLEIYVRDKIFENSAAMGAYAMERLNRDFAPLPNVGEISGLGLQIGIEIVEDKAARQGFDPQSGVMMDIFRKALAAGLLVRVTDQSWSPSNRLSFAPPLIVTKQEVDRMLGILFPIIAGLAATS